MRVGILGGTGFDAALADAERVEVETPWGDVPVWHRREGATELFFVNRHGADVLPPHRIVHRANIEALARCGVDAVFSLNAVGALDPAIAAPALLVPDDYLDMRRQHETFHETRAVHVDVGEAYCPALRTGLLKRARGAVDGGVYVAVEGPRLETRAEVRMLRLLGGSVVGMTGCPEAALARERAMCYASLCLVVNAAAGTEPLAAETIRAEAARLGPVALRAVIEAATDVDAARGCACRSALDHARL